MAVDSEESTTQITLNKDVRRYVCYFVKFSDSGTQECVEMVKEKSCAGNFLTLQACENYAGCVNGHSKFNVARMFYCL